MEESSIINQAQPDESSHKPSNLLPKHHIMKRWTLQERAVMLEFVEKYKTSGEHKRMSWMKLSEILGSRTPRQCYRQYCKVV